MILYTPLKRKCPHFDDNSITACIERCHFLKLSVQPMTKISKWQDFRFSFMISFMLDSRIPLHEVAVCWLGRLSSRTAGCCHSRWLRRRSGGSCRRGRTNHTGMEPGNALLNYDRFLQNTHKRHSITPRKWRDIWNEKWNENKTKWNLSKWQLSVNLYRWELILR